MIEALTKLAAAVDAMRKHPTPANLLYVKQCVTEVEKVMSGT